MLTVNENSYINVANADSYFQDRLFCESWTNASASDKEKALIMATKKIDRQPLRGRKVVLAQLLQFPRMYYSDSPEYIRLSILQNNFNTNWYVQNTVPQEVLDATCEEALAILTVGNAQRVKLQQQGVKSFSVGSLSESYSGSSIKILSQEAKELLLTYLAGSVQIC